MSPAQRLRVGLLGCGAIASYFHLRTLQRMPRATLVAVADPDAQSRARAEQVARVPVYEHAQDLLERDDIDAVVICAATGVHAELAVAAARSRRHFYVEKPLATDLADAHQVIEAVAAAQVTAAVGFNRRFHPLFEQARELLRGGRIGRVRAVHSVFCEPLPAAGLAVWKQRRETGGGVLLDLASHHIDLVRWCLHDEVVSVAASLTSDVSEHDSARVELGLAGGAQAQCFFSFGAGLAEHLDFIGDAGTLRLDRHRPALEVRVRRRHRYGLRRAWVSPTTATAAWRLYRKARPGKDPSYARALHAFVDAVAGGANQLASVEDGLRSLAVVLAAEQSALTALSAPVRLG